MKPLSLSLFCSSLRKTWGCGSVKTEKEIAAYNVICEEHHSLGPMSFGEISVLTLFCLLVVLWFTRDPGFVDGWATHLFNADKEYESILNLLLRPIFEYTFNTTKTRMIDC